MSLSLQKFYVKNDDWTKVLTSKNIRNAKSLIEKSNKSIHEQFGASTLPLKIIAQTLHTISRQYWNEFKMWAKATEIPVKNVIIANLAYELSSFGCSSVTYKGQHFRNLDWDFPQLGETSIIIVHEKTDRKIITITNPGLIGMHSGMVPYKFSISLNKAPMSCIPSLRIGPLFLLRQVLERAKDYTEAIKLLSRTSLSTPTLFMLVGPDSNACIIERTKKDYSIQTYKKKPLCLTNHYNTNKFKHLNNDEEDEYSDSVHRFNILNKKTTINTIRHAITRTPLSNDITVQQMHFHPTTGEFSGKGVI